MADNAERDRFIPFRRRDIVRMLIDDGALTTEEAKRDFDRFCRILESIFHFEFHDELEALKDSYFPMNPDLKKQRVYSREELDQASDELFQILEGVLNDANYDEISADEIAAACETSVALKVKIKIDMDEFESIRFFYRGRHMEQTEKRKPLGLKKKAFEHEVLERVVLLVRFKHKEHFNEKRLKELPFEPGTTVVKLFKDVPKGDLEMLFPNSQIAMAMKDKLLLAVPAVGGIVPLLVTKVLPAIIVIFVVVSAYFGVEGKVEQNQLKQAIAAFSALAALGGYCLKQWMKYKNKRYQFQKELSDNLYFRNLVNNVGVFHSLVDAAEESECKEAFLAYYFLSTSHDDLTEPELDAKIERWFQDKHNCKLDFECDDALKKLERFNLLEKRADNVLTVPTFEDALKRLDTIWDNYFQYADQ